MTGIWTWRLATAMSELCEDRLTLAELEASKASPASVYWEIDESPVDVAEAISAEAGELGLRLPSTDPGLFAWLARRGTPVPVASAPTGAVLRRTDGELAYRLPAAAMESFGDGFAVIEFSAARYDAAWLIPGVAYLYEAP